MTLDINPQDTSNNLNTESTIEVIDLCIDLYSKTEFENSNGLWNKYSIDRDKEQLFIEYFTIKNREWITLNNLIIADFINYNHRADYLRALSYFGYKNELLEVILKESIKNVYLAILENCFERYGEDEFFNLLDFLKVNGVEKFNGPQNILIFASVIVLTNTQKLEILKRLIKTGIDIYKRRSVQQKELGIQGDKIQIEELNNEKILEELGLPDEYAEKLKIISAQEGPPEKLIELFKVSKLPRRILDKMIINFVQNIDSTFNHWNLLLVAVSERANVEKSKHYPIEVYLEIGLKAKKLGNLLVLKELSELIESSRATFKSDKSFLFQGGLFMNYFSGKSFLRKRVWSGQEEILDFIDLFLLFNNGKIDYSILRYFNNLSSTENFYTTRFSDYTENSYFITAIDFYEGIKDAVETNDVERAKIIYDQVLKKPHILDERHHYVILKLAVDRNDITLYNELLIQMGPIAEASTWILSIKSQYLIFNGQFTELKKTLINFYIQNGFVRDEEIISIARDLPLSKFVLFEDIIDSLYQLGYKIPSKAIHSLAEKLSNNVVQIQRLIDKYENILGDEICFTELQLLFSHISSSGELEARNTAIKILKRNLDVDFREHVSKLLERPNLNIHDEAILALKFKFGSENQVEEIRKLKYSRSSSSLVRNSAIVRKVKDLYGQKCQVCRQLLNTPLGNISEAAHIQALGSPHFGPDEIGNILCLCPNHHKLLDNCGIFINNELEVIETLTGIKVADLMVSDEHIILTDCTAYHRNYSINSSHRGKRIWS